jgi:hypothetical protein
MKSSLRETRLPLWSRPGYLIRRLHQIHCALFLEECRESGLTPVQYGLLTALTFRGGGHPRARPGGRGGDTSTPAAGGYRRA